MKATEACKIPLVLKGVLCAECEREKGHKGRHKGKSNKPIYTELEWTLKNDKKQNTLLKNICKECGHEREAHSDDLQQCYAYEDTCDCSGFK